MQWRHSHPKIADWTCGTVTTGQPCRMAAGCSFQLYYPKKGNMFLHASPLKAFFSSFRLCHSRGIACSNLKIGMFLPTVGQIAQSQGSWGTLIFASWPIWAAGPCFRLHFLPCCLRRKVACGSVYRTTSGGMFGWWLTWALSQSCGWWDVWYDVCL